MGNERYEAGDTVPEVVCSVPTGWVFVRFAVDVEISHADGSKHIYPTEQVEVLSDLFTNGEATMQNVLAEDVQLYTTPRRLLSDVCESNGDVDTSPKADSL